jgi:hypothetical protein
MYTFGSANDPAKKVQKLSRVAVEKLDLPKLVEKPLR